jgi:hypothetical protein
MKKAFALHSPGKADARVLESVKNDVRKYVKRERKKPLPEGFDVWEFNCRIGADVASAEAKTLKDVSGAIDQIALTGVDAVYVEILAVPGRRAPGAVVPPVPLI